MNNELKDLIIRSGIPNEDLMDLFTDGKATICEYALENFAELIISRTVNQIVIDSKGTLNPAMIIEPPKNYFKLKPYYYEVY